MNALDDNDALFRQLPICDQLQAWATILDTASGDPVMPKFIPLIKSDAKELTRLLQQAADKLRGRQEHTA